VTLFTGEIPDAYAVHKVDPCAVLRLARDGDEPVFVDRNTHDCTHGQFLMGFGDGSEVIKTARLLPLYISAYSQEASTAVNSGTFTFPQGALTGIGAAPLDRVPDGVAIDSIVLVCTPFWASSLGAVRTVEDGTPPNAAAGSSFCSDAFATTYYTENVIVAPGDVGGRINNKLRPEEMFVVIPVGEQHRPRPGGDDRCPRPLRSDPDGGLRLLGPQGASGRASRGVQTLVRRR
jgi:uncharacterized protein (DUF169 family)